MKKIIITLLISLISVNAFAASTYYVRSDGGTSTQCTGTTNAAYSGSGTAQNCAFNHPVWALGGFGTSAKMVGGDTLIIKDTLADNTTQATYPIGNSMPNTSGCSIFAPLNCTMLPPPSGTPTATTKIYGSSYNTGCATKPQLYGVQRVKTVINLQNTSNVDIQCIEITDHSNCGDRVGTPVCSENYNGSSVGDYGLYGVSGAYITNLTMKNVDVHGMSDRNFLLGDLSGTNLFSHVNMIGGYQSNWDGDDRSLGGTGSINNGTIIMDHVINRFAGCSEAYPRSSSFSVADYSNCTDQNDNPPGYGDGLGTYTSGGIWIITDSDFSHNVQDGLDLLYCQNCSNVSIDRSTFEGNGGNQLKATTSILNLTNSVVVNNCNYFQQAGKIKNTSNFTNCRAGGDALSLTPLQGSVFKLTNNTIYNYGGASAVLYNDRYGTCNGTETYTYKNNVYATNSATSLYLNSGLTGGCATAFNNSTTDHSDIYNWNSAPSGTGNITTNPLFVASISQSASSNLSAVFLQSGSPARSAGASATVWNTKADVNNFPWNSLTTPDAGGIQYLSTTTLAQPGQACTATTDCASGTCSNFLCTGSCTAHGNACSGNTCCGTDTCQASVCSVPATCGDGIIQPGETCDTSNLNGSNCTLQGFTGGSLTCAADCKSFVTSSCTNTTLFPLTPVLDTFTRANSTGFGSNNWVTLAGAFNISSNALLPTTVNGTTVAYWSASAFTADEEVYTTISNKGSNGDNVQIYLRYNPTTRTGYKLESTVGSNLLQVYKVTPGEVLLGSNISQSLSSGDSIGLSVTGATLTVWYKPSGGSWTSLTTRSDSTYTTGGNVAISSPTGAGTPDIKFKDFGGGSLNPITCGNNLKEGSEICDGTDLASQTCQSQGFASGTLSCASNCQSFVTSSCVTASVCGNSTKETGEICDGIDLTSQTCIGLGFAGGGSISCASNCLSFNTSGCISSSSGIRGGLQIR